MRPRHLPAQDTASPAPAEAVARAETGAETGAEPGTPPDVRALLTTWVQRGYLTAEQADRILADAEPAPPSPPPSPPEPSPSAAAGASLVVEALGYLGGGTVVVASSLLVAQYWSHLSTGWRAALLGVVAVVLLAAGLAVPARLAAQGWRIRSVLWVLSGAALALALGLLGADAFHWGGRHTALMIGVSEVVYLAALWRRGRTALLQAGLLAAVVVTAVSASAHLPDARGEHLALAVVGVGGAWAVLGWGRVLAPVRAATLLGPAVVVGGVVSAAANADWGQALGIVVLAALVSVAVALRDLWVLAVAVVGTALMLPSIVDTWFPGRAAAAFALLVVGLALLGAAVLIARRGRDRAAGPARWHGLARRTAIGCAAGTVVGTAGVVVLLAAVS